MSTDANDLVTLVVTINGTDSNPFARWGMRQNPFPQVSTSQAPIGGQLALASLGGEPVTSEQDIRDRLTGFAPDFIEGVIARWVPGQIVKFTITFPRVTGEEVQLDELA